MSLLLCLQPAIIKSKDDRKQDCFLYSFVCRDANVTGEFVAQTSLTMKKAMKIHEQKCKNEGNTNYNTTLYVYIRDHGGWNNFYADKIETCLNITSTQLREKKRKRIEETPNNINVNRPITSLEEDKAKHVESWKEWYLAYKDYIAEHMKGYYKENKECRLEYQKEYDLTHKEERKAYNNDHRDEINAKAKERYRIKEERYNW